MKIARNCLPMIGRKLRKVITMTEEMINSLVNVIQNVSATLFGVIMVLAVMVVVIATRKK